MPEPEGLSRQGEGLSFAVLEISVRLRLPVCCFQPVLGLALTETHELRGVSLRNLVGKSGPLR